MCFVGGMGKEVGGKIIGWGTFYSQAECARRIEEEFWFSG